MEQTGIERYMERCRAAGLKLTPQRLAILRCLEGNTSHPSAEDVFMEVKGSFPTMSFATVYNTLETLQRRGMLLELTIDPERRRYDPDTSAHHHLICLRCREVVDVRAEFALRVPREQTKAFEITGNHIEFYGLCPGCRKESEKEDGMAVFKCEKCGASKEGRCKPRKCPKCGSEGTMKKKQ
jgi:Fur family peroxide stress response transcriptional regulator